MLMSICRYQADHVYALGTVYFMCAAIGVFALAHGLSTYSPKWVLNNKVGAKMRALVRYLSYSTVKQYRGGLRVLPSASLGVGLLVLVGVVFFAGLFNTLFFSFLFFFLVHAGFDCCCSNDTRSETVLLAEYASRFLWK